MDPAISFPQNWTAPPELARALPREVRLTGTGIFLMIVGAMFLLASIPVTLVSRDVEARRAAHAAALRADGRNRPGEITRLWHTDKDSRPMVSYRFTVKEHVYTAESDVPQEIWKQLFVGGQLGVRYLPSDPSVSHPTDWEDPPAPAWKPFVIGGGIALVSGVFVVVVRGRKKLVAEGTAAPGVVSKCVRVKGGWMVEYAFRLREGTVQNGRGQINRRLEIGANLCILYDPEKPRNNCPYPVSMYRVV